MRMNKAKCKIILRKDFSRKNLTNSLVLRIRLNGKTKFFSLGHSVAENFWKEKDQEVSSQAPDSKTINTDLGKFLSDAKMIIAQANLSNNQISFSAFDELFYDNSVDRNDYFAFVENDI